MRLFLPADNIIVLCDSNLSDDMNDFLHANLMSSFCKFEATENQIKLYPPRSSFNSVFNRLMTEKIVFFKNLIFLGMYVIGPFVND